MRILTHYFFARFIALFATVLVASLALVATVELVLNLEELGALPVRSVHPTGSSADPRPLPTAPASPAAIALVGARFLWARIASLYVTDLIAIAAFVASFLTCALAGRRLEWTVVEAGGIRPLRVIVPILAAAGLVAGASVLVEETVVLSALHARLAEDRAEDETLDQDRRAFWYHRGPILTNIGHADPASHTLHDVELFERGSADASGRIVRVVRADRVRIQDDGTWLFDEASVWLFDPADPAARPSFERHPRYRLDLESLPRHTLADADPAIAPIATLARHLAHTRSSGSVPDRRLAAAYHERASRPARVVALCILALPFGLRVDRGGRLARAAGTALVALAAFLTTAQLGAALTRLELLPVGLVSWGVPLGFAGLGAFLLARRGV